MELKDTSSSVCRDPRLEIGRRVRACREGQGLSIRKLAGMTGVDRTVINDIELGRGNPQIKTFMKIADGLGVELAMFFVDEEHGGREGC